MGLCLFKNEIKSLDSYIFKRPDTVSYILNLYQFRHKWLITAVLLRARVKNHNQRLLPDLVLGHKVTSRQCPSRGCGLSRCCCCHALFYEGLSPTQRSHTRSVIRQFASAHFRSRAVFIVSLGDRYCNAHFPVWQTTVYTINSN